MIIRHSFDFMLLILVLSLGVGGLVYFRFEVASQIAVAVIMAILYVLWGIYHHFLDHDLTAKIVWEYIAISALVVFVLITFLLRV